jgi:hypothetical protein
MDKHSKTELGKTVRHKKEDTIFQRSTYLHGREGQEWGEEELLY